MIGVVGFAQPPQQSPQAQKQKKRGEEKLGIRKCYLKRSQRY
jgi:hypothetical protein